MKARLLAALGRLSATEKARAEALFAAILGEGAGAAASSAGAPSFASLDKTELWRAIETRTAADFGVGFRAMLHTLDHAPLLLPRFRKRFHALSPAERVACVEALATTRLYVVRQSLAAMKILACFAWFDAPAVRAPHAAAPIPPIPAPPGEASR